MDKVSSAAQNPANAKAKNYTATRASDERLNLFKKINVNVHIL